MPQLERLLVVLPRGGAGGAGMAALELADRVRDRGLALAVDVAVAGGEPVDWDGPVSRLPRLDRHGGQLLPLARELRAVVRATRPSLVHGHGVGLGLAVAAVTGGGRRLPALTTLHGLPPEDLDRASLVLRLAGLPVASVCFGLTYALTQRGVRLTTIANAVAPAPTPMSRGELLDEFGLPGDVPVLAAVGRLVEAKSPLHLVRVLPFLDDAVALFVGDGPMASQVEAEAAALGVGDRVWVTGWRRDARRIMGATDVVVALSRWEGFARVGLEALAAGVPLVAARGDVFAGLVRDGVEGLLVDPDDPEAVADAVTRVLRDRSLHDDLVQAGLIRSALFDLEGMVDAYGRLYARLMAR